MKKRDLRPETIDTQEPAEERPEQPRELDDDDLKAVVGGGGNWWSGFTEGGGGG